MPPVLRILLLLFLAVLKLAMASQIIRSDTFNEHLLIEDDPIFTLDRTGFLLACRTGQLAVVNRLLGKCSIEILGIDDGFVEAAGNSHWSVVLVLLQLENLCPSSESNHVFYIALEAERLDVLKGLMAHPNFIMNNKDLIVRASQSHSPKMLEVILDSNRIDVLDPSYFYILLAVLECDHASLARTALSHPGITIATEIRENDCVQIIDLLRTRMPCVQNIFVSHPGTDVSVFSELDRWWNNDLSILEACRRGNLSIVRASIPTLIAKTDLLDLCLRIAMDNKCVELFRILEPAVYQIRDQLNIQEAHYYPHLNAITSAFEKSQLFGRMLPDELLKDAQRMIIHFLWLTCSYT